MLQAGLQKQGLADGVKFSLDSKIGNTRNAHRLIQLGKTKGNETENRVVLELFKSYFEESGDITSFDMLIDAAAKAGVDREEAKTWLEGDAGGETVDEEVEQAYAKGIQGVPNFTIQGKYVLGGAQDPSDFCDVIIAAKEGKLSDSLQSEICT